MKPLDFLEYGLLGCPSHLVLLVGTTILKGLREVFRIRGVRALGFLKVWPARMPQPQSCRSSAWNHHPERAHGGVIRIRDVRVCVFFVWPAWMPQPQSCSSARNHHPERAQGDLKD